jgi:YHS domain-containing protein
MRKTLIITIIMATAGFFVAALPTERAIAKAVKAQTICPVMGDPINKKYFIDYKGYRIYFCCASCPDDFRKNPEKYMKKLRESGVTLEKAPDAKAKKDADGHAKHKHHGE